MGVAYKYCLPVQNVPKMTYLFLISVLIYVMKIAPSAAIMRSGMA